MEKLLNNIDIRKAFSKDFNIPVIVIDKELFLERVKILGYYKELFNYLEIIQKFDNPQSFFDYRNKIRENAINFIKKQDNYKLLNKNSFNIEILNYKLTPEKLEEINRQKINKNISKNLYTIENLNKKFISLDMKNANFQIFKLLNIIKEDTYEKFMNKFDNLNYFYKSKYIRQYIFGNTNPKRNIYIQKNIMKLVLLEILSVTNNIKNIVLNNDELVLEYSENLNDNLDKILSKLDKIILKKEIFILKELKANNGKIYFVKEKENSEKTLHTVPKNLYIQAFKKINNIPINDKDLIFEYEGELVKFLKKQF